MWILRKSATPGEFLRRIASLLATSLLVATFVTVFANSTPAYAAPAQWSGDELTYEDNLYTPTSVDLPDSSAEGDTRYMWIDSLERPQKAYVIYFDAENPQLAREAQLVVFDYVPPDDYGNPGAVQTIEVTTDLTGGDPIEGDDIGTTCSSTAVPNIGWLLCPISNFIADGVDWMYGIVNDFLEVPVITSDSNSGIYALWQVLLGIANVCFALVFLVIIYSHLTSAGFSNYNIKVMLPRLLIAAVLVNVSFWICALAIDLSNLLGHSINNVFSNIRDNMTTNADVDWSGLTLFIVSGGIGGAYLGISAAAAGSFGGLAFLLIAALAGVAFSVFVAFVILAARQAIITVLLILSPLAFVAFVLPSTQDLFNKWRKSFTTLLMLFPVFAVLFGGSGVAGAAIMNAADGKLHLVLIGMATQVMPLVLTPLLIQFSTGLLGRIAGMANSSTRGWADRTKNWAHDNADALAANKRAKWQKMAADGNKRRYLNPMAMTGVAMDQGKRRRDRMKNSAEDYLDKSADKKWQQRLNNGQGRADRRLRQQYMDSHDMHKTAETYKGELDQAANKHWQSRLDVDSDTFKKDIEVNRDIRASVINTVQLKDETDEMETNFNAIVAEMKTGVNPYSNASDDIKRRLGGIAGMNAIDAQAEAMHTTADNLMLEQSRQNSAELELKSRHTKMIKENANVREYAGGIDDFGATRVYASAIEAQSSEYMKNVGAMNVVYSNEGYTAQDLMDISQRKKSTLNDGSKVNNIHIHAAVQRINSEIGNNWAVQKMADYIAEQGMTFNEKTEEFSDRHGNILSKDEVESRRDLQQMFRDGYNKGKVRVSTISNTDLTAMENGTYTIKTEGKFGKPVTLDDGTTRVMVKGEQAMVRDMNDDKFSENRWVTEDVDVLSRYIQALRSDDIRGLIKDDQRAGLAQQIQKALHNPLNRDKIKGREGQLLQVIEKYLKADKTLSRSEKIDFESTYRRLETDASGKIVDGGPVSTTQKVPTHYNIGKQNDFDDGEGPA